MRINIFYASWFGNGKKVVEELSDILKERNNDVKLFSILDISAKNIPEADLLIFSSPTRKFSLPSEVKNFILNIEVPLKQAKYALITTYLDPRTIALKKMEALLDSRGMQKIAESLKVKSLGLKGPLEEGYRARLEAFADDLLKTGDVQKTDDKLKNGGIQENGGTPKTKNVSGATGDWSQER